MMAIVARADAKDRAAVDKIFAGEGSPLALGCAALLVQVHAQCLVPEHSGPVVWCHVCIASLCSLHAVQDLLL